MPTETHAPDELLSNRAVELLHRVSQASPETCNAADMKELQKWVHGYQCKFGPDKNPWAPRPIDLAQLLAIASVDELRNMLLQLMTEREPADWRRSWYLLITLKRIHGIEFVKDRKQMGKSLGIVQGGKQAPPHKSRFSDPPRTAA